MAHHRVSPDPAVRQRPLCSGARPSAQPYVACRDETGIASDHFKAGNDRNASPGELDFMHGGMTRRHEGSFEHDAHRKRFEYCTAGVSLQGVSATKWTVQADKHAKHGVFRLGACKCVTLRRKLAGLPRGRAAPERAAATRCR